MITLEEVQSSEFSDFLSPVSGPPVADQQGRKEAIETRSRRPRGRSRLGPWSQISGATERPLEISPRACVRTGRSAVNASRTESRKTAWPNRVPYSFRDVRRFKRSSKL